MTETEFKIAFLAPEGAPVKQGDAVLGFDTETLVRLLAEKQAELAEATKKVEQKELDLRMKRLDLDQRTALARADLTKAELKADAPPIAVSAIELASSRSSTRRGRERDLANLAAERPRHRGDLRLRAAARCATSATGRWAGCRRSRRRSRR